MFHFPLQYTTIFLAFSHDFNSSSLFLVSVILLQLDFGLHVLFPFMRQGIWKIAREIGKKCDFVSEKCNFCQKVQKSKIQAQKCKITDFAQIVHNNAILLK